jgi:hypothetical protein
MCAGAGAGYGAVTMNRTLRTTTVTALAGGLTITLMLLLTDAIERWGSHEMLPGVGGDTAGVTSLTTGLVLLPATLASGWTMLALHLGGRRHPVLTGLLPGLPAAAWTAVALAVLVEARPGILLQLALQTFAPVLFATMLLTAAAPIAALATNRTQPAPRGWLAAHGLAAAALPLAMAAAYVAGVRLTP